ncbi:MAG TPA: hypothetical protein VJK09_02860 [Candidatus Paceibacterota bacterium]
MVVEPHEELLVLARENNKILKSLRAHNRWSTFSHVIYWLLIVGSVIVTFRFIQPYISSIVKAYDSFQGAIGSFPKVP